MRACGLFILFLLLGKLLIAQQSGIRGSITNRKGEAVAYVTIYCTDQKKGTNSNADGHFELSLPEGKHDITFQSIDYISQSLSVVVESNKFDEVNLLLDQQVYALKEFKVSANEKNPAVYIMRKAIAAAPYYRRQVLQYQARVYIKGSGMLEHVPLLLRKTFAESGLVEGKTLLTESINELQFSQPNTYKEKVISLKSSIQSKDIPEPMQMVKGSFYDTRAEDVISPLSPEAFSVYDFIFQGSFYESGREVNKIKVQPKRRGTDVYSGSIYIIDGLWCIHSLDLNEEQNGFLVNSKVNYRAQNNEGSVWLPQTYQFNLAGSFLGIKGSFRYLATLSNYTYKLNPNVDHNWLQKQASVSTFAKDSVLKNNEAQKTKRQKEIERLLAKEKLTKLEMLRLAAKVKKENETAPKAIDDADSSDLKVDSLALRRDSLFWLQNRPLPLMDIEQKSYAMMKPDSITPKSDSTHKRTNRFGFSEVLTGGNIKFKSTKSTVYFDGLLRDFFLNTVDGWGLNTGLLFATKKTNLKDWRIKADVRVPFERRAVNEKIRFSYTVNQLHFASVFVEAGSWTTDFNLQGASSFVGAYNILVLQQNFQKLYQQDYVQAGIQQEIVNGLFGHGELWYSNRYALENIERFRQKEADGKIASNLPNTALEGFEQMPTNSSFNITAGLRYQVLQRSKMKRGYRTLLPNNYPAFKVEYAQGIAGVLNSTTDFKRLIIGMSEEASPYHWLSVRYKVDCGKFLNANQVYFPDYFQFAANRSHLYDGLKFDRFMNMDYYEYSNRDAYFQQHLDLSFKRLLLKRLPKLNMTNLSEALFFKQLVVPHLPLFTEAGYRLENIFQFFELDLYASFKNGEYQAAGFRIGIEFPH